MTAQQSEYRLGTCRWCSNRGDVYRDNGLCDSCDSDTIHCSVCRRREHWESKCRHVFQDDEFQWRGAGVNPRDQEMMVPFHRLLSAMGEDFARDLKIAIGSGKFYTWMIAPLIGGGGMLELNGMPSYWIGRAYGEALIELGSGTRAGELSEGYSWLVSLHTTNTTIANRTTIGWIDRWLWPLTPVLA